MDWIQMLAGAAGGGGANGSGVASHHQPHQSRSSPPLNAPAAAAAVTAVPSSLVRHTTPPQPPPPPPAVTLIRVGIICVRARRTAGVATYSPGLEHDAQLYERAFAAADTAAAASAGGSSVRFETVAISPDWDRSGVASEETLQALRDGLDVIIGIEELGSVDMIEAIQALKSEGDRPAPVVIWVPNPEVLDDRTTGKKWASTLAALPSGFIDLVIAKMPRREEFMRCIRQVYEAYETPLDDEQIVHVPHTCLQSEAPVANKKKKYHQQRAILAAAASPSSAASSASASPSPAVPSHPPSFFDLSARTTILHFAGSSPHKNTLENCRAGLELVKQLNAADAESLTPPLAPRFTFTVFLCAWPSKRGDVQLYAIGLEAYEAIKALQAANSDCFNLIATGFMPYPQRAKLYAQTRLALCASRAEGFGHYVLEAAASGCLVVTTDAAPMSSLCTVPNTFALATPTQEERQCYGFASIVPAESIVSAALTLPLLESGGYNSSIISACAQNETATRTRFVTAMRTLKQRLSAMVQAEHDRWHHAQYPTTAAPKTFVAVMPPMPLMPTLDSAPAVGTFKKGVFLASSMSASPAPSTRSDESTPTSAPPSLHFQQHAPVVHHRETSPAPPHAIHGGFAPFSGTSSFDGFASLFASASIAASAPPPATASSGRLPPGLHIPSHAPHRTPSIPLPLSPPPPSAMTFHSGTSSLAALEARLRASQTAPLPPPPPPATIKSPTPNILELGNPWLPWPA